MPAKNILILLSDEHNAEIMGCAGHPLVKTPHLDTLASHGVRFTSAYTPSPICVPARASLATGLPVYQHCCWDNAIAYQGLQPSWGHVLQQAGIPVESIGKLHYRRAEDNTGFDKQHEAVHIMDGIGQVFGSVRNPLPQTIGPMALFDTIGAGESSYNRFDRRVANTAVEWLYERNKQESATPWVLFVSLVAPHFPLIVPQEYLDLYPLHAIPLPRLQPSQGYQRHPWVQRQVDFTDHDAAVGNDERKRLAIASYYALTTFMDEQLGKVLNALKETRFADNTTIIYSSDHGDNMGVRGTWNKCLLYKESTAIPLIISGPNIPENKLSQTPASLVDIFPTIIDVLQLEATSDVNKLPGESLLKLATMPDNTQRLVLSEYHAIGSESAGYMLADANFKYHEYVGYEPELFDLQKDPGEEHNLAALPEYAATLNYYAAALRRLLDPEETDKRAKHDQDQLVESFGGREKALAMGTPGATPVP